jgi:hypothetical protein
VEERLVRLKTGQIKMPTPMTLAQSVETRAAERRAGLAAASHERDKQLGRRCHEN